MPPSYRQQVFRSSALMVVVALGLAGLSVVVAPSAPLAAAFGVACLVVFAGVVTDRLDDRFGLVWLGFGLAAAVVYLSGDAAGLRAHAVALVGAALAGALLWFVPAKAAELGERVRKQFRD
ncbi:voltage-gated potassium channel Kch [Halarchaeum rubridurum]|uniref:Voltage-gated potassium channel Kch n=1 Tax=Halarchaeum rubridurum TaxID=489911 RepID=A0A830FY20_9EURY|nr:hypothetical protein [Halarchaeum rubridurum]MBP1954288.1 voltage-gated potassium channel Kch [Halarchaeum rubridurum]GGM58832.1 hypothetical protein GCM10009017_06220 [Halarchaeum rubridurum]